MHVVYEKEYEPQTAVVMYPVQAGITKPANSCKVAEGDRAVHWRKDLLLVFPLACT